MPEMPFAGKEADAPPNFARVPTPSTLPINVPATVDTTPALVILRTIQLPVSPTYTLLDESTATAHG
jgi:hypothetical protein